MKRSVPFITCLFVLALVAVPCRAFAFFGVEVSVGIWNQTPSGTTSYKPVAGTVGDIDLKNDMHLNTENQFLARVKVELPLVLPNIYFMATPMSFKGTGSKNVDISFGGQTFIAGVPFDSVEKLDHYDLALYYPIPFLKTATLGKVNAELGLDARQIAFEGTISGGGQNGSKTMTVYLPMIYAGIQIRPISLIGIEGEVRGVSYGSNRYIDYIGRLKINPIPVLFVAGGYRAETVKLDVQNVKADIEFSGPFAEVGLSF